jgi:uncharacterized protein YkwD
MPDSDRGMEGSKHRIRTLTRSAASTLVLAGVIAVAGCGGGGGSKSTAPPSPVNQAPSGAGGVVSADATQGLVGPSARATGKSQQFSDKTGKIPGNANHRPKSANGVAGGEACQNTDITPAADNLDTANEAILCLVNGERAVESLPPLTQNPQLDKAASGMAARMVSEHFFSHDTPDGKNVVDRVQPTGYIPSGGDWVVGENLAWGSGALSTPQAIVNGWMNSPGHKANVLAPDYKDIGLAAAMGSPTTTNSGGTVYVNNFGAKSGADVNAKLPVNAGSSGGDQGAAATTVAGTKATAAAKAKAKAKARAKARAKKKAKARKRKRN